MLSKGADLPRPPPTHPEETEEELTETSEMQEDDGGAGPHRCGTSDNQSVRINDWLRFIFTNLPNRTLTLFVSVS